MYDLQRERELIEFSSEPADLTQEEEYEFYKKYALRTKEDVLTEIREAQNQKKKIRHKDRSEDFHKRLNALLDTFYEEITSHLLMEPLDNFWGYSFEVRETGITLNLEHLMLTYDFVGKDYPNWWEYSATHTFSRDDGFPILEVKARLLTLEEYGKAYGVEAGSVRQWIRRGKLRSACKFGNEWRVPELTERTGREYLGGHYLWKTDLPDPPSEVPDINDADSLSIFRNLHTGEWTASLECIYKKGMERTIVLDNKEKEKLELYLISHPLVECYNNYIFGVRQKNGSQYEMMKPNERLKNRSISELHEQILRAGETVRSQSTDSQQ